MPTLGYYAKLLREQGARRIERLKTALDSKQASKRTRNWAREQIKEIKSAMQGTRQYSTTGKRYKSKSERYIGQQMSRLAKAVAEVEPRYTIEGDPFEITQRELNKASVKAPSIYTKLETQIFYRATQEIWQKKGVDLHDRNEEILNHFNNIRRENGLSPMQLSEIVGFVLTAKERMEQLISYGQDATPDNLSAEERKWLGFLKRGDNEDAPKGSPITASVASMVEDSMSLLYVLPDVTKYLESA